MANEKTTADNPVLPFTLEFEPAKFNNEDRALPNLQSYAGTVSKDGYLLLLGGRFQGLHTFKGGNNNFNKAQSNKHIYVIDPTKGDCWSFDVTELNPELSAFLQGTDQQAYHNRYTDDMVVAGGYGWKADGSDMETFGCIIQFQVEALVAAVMGSANPKKIESLITVAYDERFAITGGEMFLLDGIYYLVCGQIFNGQYSAFGGADFYQVYSEEIRMFTLEPGTLKILNYGVNKNSDPDHPLHRRDGNIFEDIDPTTARPRISCLGGVFPPGIIGGYTYPVYINGPKAPIIDRGVSQKFSQYQCPVIGVFDESGPMTTIYNTFFGGISHHYYFQTKDQQKIFELATMQGRNDGLPFISDITTFCQHADGTYGEYINKEPIPGTKLLGTSSRFLVNPEIITSGLAFPNGVAKLSKVQANKPVLLGYIYGGIEAKYPYPEIPNEGTVASNHLFHVYLSRMDSEVFPASLGHLAK